MFSGISTWTYFIWVANLPTSSNRMFCSGLVVGLMILFCLSLNNSAGGCGSVYTICARSVRVQMILPIWLLILLPLPLLLLEFLPAFLRCFWLSMIACLEGGPGIPLFSPLLVPFGVILGFCFCWCRVVVGLVLLEV